MPVHIIRDPQITINSVDLTDHVRKVELTQTLEDVDTTAAGGGGKQRIAGLEDASISLDFNQNYDAAEVDATLSSIIGSAVAVSVKAGSGSVSATNPMWSGTVVITDYKPIMGQVGSLNEVSVSWPFNGGLTRATA